MKILKSKLTLLCLQLNHFIVVLHELMQKHLQCEQVDILISKNQALQILYLKQCVCSETT